ASGDALIGWAGGVWLAIGGARDRARIMVIIVVMRLFSWRGEDLFEAISMILVLAIFLGGFFVDEEAL
ncbi:hypothetical protein Tco_1326250, partial [Tanacetum coccineum]